MAALKVPVRVSTRRGRIWEAFGKRKTAETTSEKYMAVLFFTAGGIIQGGSRGLENTVEPGDFQPIIQFGVLLCFETRA